MTFENYLNPVNTIINSHAPLKQLNKKQRKFQQKPWITKGIQNVIEKKNRLFKKCIKWDDYNQEFKAYTNSLSTLLKQSKKSYYNNYFRNNINNIKNNQKGIKSKNVLNTKESEPSKIILNNKGDFFTNQNGISYQFNNIFCFVVPTVQSNIRPNFKSFDRYLIEACKETFLISPYTKNKILAIISSLYYNKAIGINSILIEILKLAKEQIA